MKLKRNKHQAGILKAGDAEPNPYILGDPMKAFYERTQKAERLKKRKIGQYWDFSRKLKPAKFKIRPWTEQEVTAGFVRSQMLEEMDGAVDGEGSGILLVSEVQKRLKEEMARPKIILTPDQTAEFLNSGKLPMEFLKSFKEKSDGK